MMHDMTVARTLGKALRFSALAELHARQAQYK